MAVLSASELAELRSALTRNTTTQTWTKAQVGAALQAIEDRVRLAGTQTTIANDIEAAAPGIFSAGQKTTLFGIWCLSAARRLGITS
jgi:hypothetical protein